jgi:hypothetical protein
MQHRHRDSNALGLVARSRDHPYPEIYYHTIHHVDTVRAWLRDPIQIYASLARYPGITYNGPMRNYMVFVYPNNLRATFLVNHEFFDGCDHRRNRTRKPLDMRSWVRFACWRPSGGAMRRNKPLRYSGVSLPSVGGR